MANAYTAEELSKMLVANWLTSKPTNAALDNVSLLTEIFKNGRDYHEDFSNGIIVNNILNDGAASATDREGNGMETGTNTLNGARVDFKHYARKIAIKKSDLDIAVSDHKRADPINAAMVSCMSSILNGINVDLYGDGSGSSGFAIDGFALAVSSTPGVGAYAGIDPAINEQWQNGFYDASTDATLPNNTAALTEDNILKVIDYIMTRQMHNGMSISHIVVSSYYYTLISMALKKDIRYSNKGGALKGGATSLIYDGAIIVNAGGLQRSSKLAGASLGIGDKEMYFLTMNDIHLAYNNPYKDKDKAWAKKYGIETKDINAIVYPNIDPMSGSIFFKDDSSHGFYIEMMADLNIVLSARDLHAKLIESV